MVERQHLPETSQGRRRACLGSQEAPLRQTRSAGVSCWGVAQLVEHEVLDLAVAGSNPAALVMHATRKAFYRWLCQQRNREDKTGDFARDVFWRKSTPRNSENPEVWRIFCKKHQLPFLLDGFDQAWEEYLNECPDS